MIDPVAAALVALYFILMVGIGIWASKKINTMSDYVVAGRSLNFWVFTMLMIGYVCSGMSLLGVSGLGYRFAWPTIWEQLAVPLSIAFCIIFFGVKMHTVAKKSGYITVQDYLAHRFESEKSLRGMSALAGIVVSMIYLAGQYTAISIVLMWLFGLPHWIALLIGAAIVTVYTVIGGLYAVSWTTLVQGLRYSPRNILYPLLSCSPSVLPVHPMQSIISCAQKMSNISNGHHSSRSGSTRW